MDYIMTLMRARYLTLDTPALDRFPISFKTTFNGNTYRHVVLGVYSLGKYGALGMSRRDDLMYKPLVYKVCLYRTSGLKCLSFNNV